jgi:hypothetical protein
MHAYRIVLTGDSIAVYYDGTPTLIGHMFHDPASQPDASIIWGEASGAATGTSEWEYFQHNAGLSISSPNLVRWSANGHCYEAVYAPGLTWEQARSQCENRCGYLATITAHDEECLVESLFETNPAFWYVDGSGNALGPWTGGYQQPGSTEPGDGWGWFSGEPFVYANWSFHDPDNCCSVNENRIEFIRDHNVLPTRWTDVDSSAIFVQGYIFESDDCDSGTANVDTPTACATASVLPSPHPQSLERLDVLPNPIRGSARLSGRLAGTTNGEAEVTIHDVSGRRIARQFVSVVGGSFETSWETLTRGRGALPAGVYMVSVRSGVAAVHRTVIVTR